MHLDAISAAAARRRAAPPASIPSAAPTRRCGDCSSVLRPSHGPRPTAARCAEAPGAPMLGHAWQPGDGAPFWCPRRGSV